jgi:alkylated DNA repair protein (DNA oxidative demethylase)
VAARPFAAPEGFVLASGRLSLDEQRALLADIRAVVAAAPLFTPRMPKTGAPFSVRMTNCGDLGWVSDIEGYRYQPAHPDTGRPWPAMPVLLAGLWAEFAPGAPAPQACLINWYAPDARMGLHQDRDERDFAAPVLSVSLGDTAKFRLGGAARSDPTRSFDLRSGDVMVLGGAARLAFHGVDRILSGTSTLLDRPGRVNLTIRRVDPS